MEVGLLSLRETLGPVSFVSAGDVIELSFNQTSLNTGDYNGVNFSINLTAVPEPSVLVLSGLAGTVFCIAVYRNSRKGKITLQS